MDMAVAVSGDTHAVERSQTKWLGNLWSDSKRSMSADVRMQTLMLAGLISQARIVGYCRA